MKCVVNPMAISQTFDIDSLLNIQSDDYCILFNVHYINSFLQCRINHCAGCTMGGAPDARAPDKLRILYHALLACER